MSVRDRGGVQAEETVTVGYRMKLMKFIVGIELWELSSMSR